MSVPPSPRLVLVGIDYSSASAKAAQYAIDLARAVGARVHLVHAWQAPYANDEQSASEIPHGATPNLLQMLRISADDAMKQFVAQLNTTGVEVSTNVESGDPRRVLIHAVESLKCDWVVVGKDTHSTIAEWFLGNVANYVVRHCQVPVLVVPKEERS